ncbi:sensor histidine kinase [Plantactinospora siamensis]|uniref:histidine kinase n=1 Tax=Plantactinospora siamensis TaxID=555372 RepID=A0ABV6NTU2_9ACTN
MTSAAVPEYRWLLPGALRGSASESGPRTRRTTRDWIIDVLCFLLAAGWALWTLADASNPTPQLVRPLPEHWMTVLDVGLGLLLSAALWARRRWPVGLALATLPLGLFTAAGSVALLIIMFSVVVHRPFAVSGPLVAASLVTSFGYAWLRPDPQLPYWAAMVWGALFTGAAMAWGMFVRARRQLIVSLRERAHRAEAEQRLRIAQARHLERGRIAREMHDVLAHRISLLSLHAGALEFRPDAPSTEVARAAGVIRTSAHAALEDLREIIGVLRADGGSPDDAAPERPQPTLADVPALVEESRAAGMRVTVSESVREPAAVPAGVGRSAYRIVQEALTNARKHAPGAAVELRLAGGPATGLDVEVRNRWPVRSPEPAEAAAADPGLPGAGTGLVGIAERVSLAGGRLEHGRDAGGDFRLAAWLPWPE